VPRAGEYLIAHGFNSFSNGATVENIWGTVKLGAAVAADAEGQYGWTNQANQAITVTKELRRTLAAGDVVKQQYRSVLGTGANVRNRFIRIEPQRVS
jgi:hypothetical protein